MRTRLMVHTLWAVAAMCVTAAAAAARWASTPNVQSARKHIVIPAMPVALDTDSLLTAFGDIAEGNLFRPDRAAADSSTVPAEMVMPALPPKPPKPSLRLRGLVGGPPWDVLLDGIPGHDGATVARVGQTIGGFIIRQVRGDTVLVRGMDTTWSLTLARQ